MNKFSKHIPTVASIALGGMLVIFGLNGFLNFIPMEPPTGDAGTFMGGLAAAGYFFPLLKITEIGVGLALLLRRYVPLALTILAPISINIVAFHLFMAPQALPVALFILIANAALAYHHRQAYRALFVATQAKAATRAVLAKA